MSKVVAKVKKVDEELDYRLTQITYSGGTIVGPTRSIGYGMERENFVVEGHRRFDKVQIERVNNDSDFQRSVEGDMKRKNIADALNLFFVNYTQSTNLTDNELTALINLQYVSSEIAITPCWSGLLKGKVNDDAISTLNEWNTRAIEAIERRNNKSIMGIIPAKVHHRMIGDVIKNYIDQDVTLFTIDQMGKSVKNSEAWLRELYAQLGEYKLMDNTFLYGLNCLEGRIMQKKDKVLAGDFIGSAYGIDVIGLNHVGAGRTPPSDGKGLPPAPVEASYRLFNEDSYAYERISERKAQTMTKMAPSRIREELKRRNISSQLREYANLGQMLNEEPSVLEYINSKEMVDSKLITSIKKVKGERRTRQTRLFN